jgi:hypothetical protein
MSGHVRYWHLADKATVPTFVRFWHKADMAEPPINVRFRG